MKKNFDKEISLKKLRNIGITAHIDAGKTTTTEKILYHAGEIRSAGKVHEGDTTTDFDEQERARGITIFSAAVTVNWKENQINIIDTPGHIDFTAEVERSLRVLDGAILILDGNKGVQAQTETVWRQANKYHIPRIIFVNKLDNTDSEEKFLESVKSLEDKLNVKPLLLQLPIGIGKELEGIIDLVKRKAYYFKKNDEKEAFSEKNFQELEETTKKKIELYRKEIIEKIIEFDEELLSNYLKNGDLEEEEITKLIRKVTISENYFPVFCGSAYKNIGVKFLLDAIVNYLPSPLDKKEITIFTKNKETDELEKKNIKIFEEEEDNRPTLLALAFKVVIDEHNNKLTFIRVYFGEIQANSYIYNSTKKERERISRLLKIQADERIEIKKAKIGEIVVALGLEKTITGDTICGEKTDFLLENINFSKPVISQAIEPKTSEDNRKLSIAFKKMKLQDPSFDFSIDEKTRELLIFGMGELQLEVIIEKLRKEYKIDLNTKKQSVSYQETIENSIETKHMHRKQTGGAGEMAEVHIKFEPNPEKGFEFIDAIRGEDVPKQFRPAIKQGLERIFSRGALLGYQIVDIKATLTGGSWHPVDSSTKAFETAGYNCFKENINKLKFVLLEPIMRAEIDFPSDYESNVIGNLNSKRGEIEEITRDNNMIKVIVLIPLSETFGYTTVLRSLTAGRVNYTAEFLKYKKVPNNLYEKIKEERK